MSNPDTTENASHPRPYSSRRLPTSSSPRHHRWSRLPRNRPADG